MPKRGAVALLLTTAALALLLSFKTPSDPGGGGTGVGRPVASAMPAASAPPAASAEPTATDQPAPAAAYADGTVDGSVVRTRWGPVQVRVTITGGVITDVIALQLPDGDRHSTEISDHAAPVLRSSALAAQSAEVDIVSGATYTSLAYAESLQAALDAARA